MKLNYIISESTNYPELVDTTSSKKFIYIRQNVIEVQKNDITFYKYDEAKLTKEEYEIYLKEISSQETLKNIKTLKEENAILLEQVDMLTSCILEISELIYA